MKGGFFSQNLIKGNQPEYGIWLVSKENEREFEMFRKDVDQVTEFKYCMYTI